MKQIADDLWQLSGFPRDWINVYLAGETLIDAGTRWARWRILRQLGGRKVSLVALTHCHPDHQGAARAVCQRYNAPLVCHEADAPAVEGRMPMQPSNWIMKLGNFFWSGPRHPVARSLKEGDEAGGFRVVHAPGHTPGHVIYFRESDRVAVAGDVLANINFLSRQRTLQLPPRMFCSDAKENVRSVVRLWELRPSLVCFGHGPPLTDMSKLDAFVERLRERGLV